MPDMDHGPEICLATNLKHQRVMETDLINSLKDTNCCETLFIQKGARSVIGQV